MARQLHGRGVSEVARARLDLCTVSVLLDAGAGAAWRYREPETGLVLQRSEGLAVASLHAFRSGLFSSDPQQPLRADAAALVRISDADLAVAFQEAPDNPLPGMADRAALLRNLGTVLQNGRIGDLLDTWYTQASNGVLTAADVLSTILDVLAPDLAGSAQVCRSETSAMCGFTRDCLAMAWSRFTNCHSGCATR